MKVLLLFIACILAFVACNKKKIFDGPDFYSDDFESYNSLEELLSNDDVNWSFTQLTSPENTIKPDTSIKHGGNKSMRFSSKKSDGKFVSKCSIAKQNMAFWEGETLRITAWYYLQGTQSAQWLFIMDMEEQVAIGAGPGMRLALVDNKICVEHKFYEDDLFQPQNGGIEMPRDQWVEIIWEVKLSQKNKGVVKVWQNGQLIIDASNTRTLPKDLLYSQQGTKGMVSSIEVGITANSRDNDLVMYVDDVLIQKIN
ncbi:MAG TPA: heparin lyase I family protein [Flavobacteriales bacterium]|nr:heparin lyase I family protein [Flavobacteriales bacterium]